jgi:NAD(P)-dependent dehydrogenase (short-subunit alcohol dehydrogenase family)
MPTMLITGSSRGIGREFVRQFAQDGWRIHAACRKPAEAVELQDIAKTQAGRVMVETLDVTDGDSVKALARKLDGVALDLLVNNAGIYGGRGQELGDIDFSAWAGVLDTNVVGPMRVTEAFRDNLFRGDRKLLVSISSRMGSIAESAGGSYLYRASKAALNMCNRNWSLALGPKGVACVVLHPGWVKTDMGGQAAAVTPEASVAGMRKLIAGFGPKDNGKFYDFEGRPIAW